MDQKVVIHCICWVSCATSPPLPATLDCELTRYSIFLMAFCTSLDIQVTSLLAFYATSSFSSHSLLSTIGVVGSVLNGKAAPSISSLPRLY